MFKKESHHSQYHAGLEHKVFPCADPVMITAVAVSKRNKNIFQTDKEKLFEHRENCNEYLVNVGKLLASTIPSHINLFLIKSVRLYFHLLLE